MPPALEGSCLVVNAKNGYTRSNCSWIISRILRDYEYWMDAAVRRRLDTMLEDRHRYMQRNTRAGTSVPRPRQTGLCISVYEPSTTKVPGEPTRDLIYWSGLAVTVLQLGIAAVPFGASGDWRILLITVGGTLLALATGSLPQWKAEKWPGRRSTHSTFVLTRGNGTQHAIVILGNGHGLNLEDLAVAGQFTQPSSSTLVRLCLGVLSVLWVVLLITAAGVTTDTWYLLAVGGIGMVQNALVARSRRDPGTLGVHLEFRRVIGEMQAMDALLKLEARYPKVGGSLLPIFFPGELLPEERASWDVLRAQVVQQEEERVRLSAQEKGSERLESWTAHARTYE